MIPSRKPRSKRTKPPEVIPDEHVEQCWLMQWCRAQSGLYPVLNLIYAIPNAAKRTPAVAAYMKAEGMKAGVPDLCLPVSRHGFHGLYIEMKRRKGGVVSKHQENWLEWLRKQGYRAEVCEGWEMARDVILEYVRAQP